ncbi:MAG: GNAT family N-acetyltransferase [Chloroflexaceae bacterium]|nr:GNAT family N-acetyltransferase [Chloroflexaceae bacterium]
MHIPVLQTSRLTLRPFVADDAAALFAYASAPEFSQYVEYSSPTTLTETRDFLEHVLLPGNPDVFSWAVCRHDQSDVIGTVQVSRDVPDAVTVYYDISHTLYGRGYTTEALQAVLRWCLVCLPEVQHFYGDTVVSNIGSRRVLEKCGFVFYKSERVQWEKFSGPVELVFYQADRKTLEAAPWNVFHHL